MEKQYGFKFDQPSLDHWVFGASALPYEELRLDGDWTPYLPVKEFQNLNNLEPYACVSFTLLNCLETLIKRKYGIDTNFSDRFLAAISGTKVGGNSPQVVCEFLRKVGVVPQELWPFDENIKTFDKFYSPIPESIQKLAEEFNREWDFKHEFVIPDHKNITKALKSSPLMISIPAWFKIGELYYRPQGMIDNHATTLFYEREGEFTRVFDSYDQPFLKDLEWGLLPMTVKRFWIEKKVPQKKTWSQKLLDYFNEIIR